MQGGKRVAVRNHVETVVNRPLDEVFPYVSDFTKLPALDPAVLSIERANDGPDRVGAIWNHTRRAGGRVITAPIRITEYDPPNRMSHVSESGPVRVEVTMVFKPEGATTRVIEDLEMNIKWPLKLLQPLIARDTIKSAAEIHARFKRQLDADVERDD
jgi:carbon monoxide dehydrogenase subunit G